MDPDPGGQKTCESCGSGSPTLQETSSKRTLLIISKPTVVNKKAVVRQKVPDICRSFSNFSTLGTTMIPTVMPVNL
jgi:hypothetical protein